MIGTSPEVAHAASLFGRHKAELGYVMRLSVEVAAQRGGIYASAHAAAYCWHRLDGQTTLHAIASEQPGEGRALLARIVADCRERGQRTILARCPQGLDSNAWYARRGFALIRTEPGKHRALNVWVLTLS